MSKIKGKSCVVEEPSHVKQVFLNQECKIGSIDNCFGLFFGMVTTNMSVLQCSIYRSKLFLSNGGGNPLHALLDGALGQYAACQL